MKSPLPVFPLLLIAAACSLHRQPAAAPVPGEPSHLSLRLSVRWQGEGPSQSGSASWRSDGEIGKLLLLDPLHRPLLELQCRGEEVLLLDRRHDRCWRGPFREALQRIWGIDLTLADLRALVEEGRDIPPGSRPGLTAALERRGGVARRVDLRTESARLQLTVRSRERRPGRVALPPPGANMRTVSLDEMTGDD